MMSSWRWSRWISILESICCSNSGTINMSEDYKTAYETIAEKVHEQLGMKVGVISSVNLNHATPAAFYAHQASRNDYYEIGLELIESADHGVLTLDDEFDVLRVALVDGGEGVDSPPAVVAVGPLLEVVPGVVGALLALGRPQGGVGVQGVEVAAVVAAAGV